MKLLPVAWLSQYFTAKLTLLPRGSEVRLWITATFSVNEASGTPPPPLILKNSWMKDTKNKCNTYSGEMCFLCGNDSERNCWPERRPAEYEFAGGNWKMLTHVSAPPKTCSVCGLSGEPVFISQEFCTIKTHRGALGSTDILVKAVRYSVNWDSSISTCVRCQFPSDVNIC